MMDNNYTPLNIGQVDNLNNQADNTKMNTFFLAAVNLAAAILAILLFIMIQRKLNQTLP